MFYQKLKNESGIAMLVVLVVTFLSTILVSSFMGIVMSESDNSMWQKRRSQSLFIAEAGVEQALYYLNNINDPVNPWVGSGQIKPTPLECEGTLSDGYYQVKLYSQTQEPWLPQDAYLIVSTGIIPRTGTDDITRTISCIVDKLDTIPVYAALSILDDTDAPAELIQFDSTEWTVDGTDMDDPNPINKKGLPGIAIANTGDNIFAQLGGRIDQVTGADEFGNGYVGMNAILQDPNLPKNLDAYANYFQRVAIDVSGTGNIPQELLGTYEKPQVLYANLSEGPLRLLPNQPGYGVLILDGIGDFKLDVSLEGRGEWFGVIICARDSVINLHGGGNTPSHIYGALLVANGNVTMNGTADIVYSSKNVNNVNFKLLLYQVYSWCDDWGIPLGSNYNPVTTEGYQTTSY